MCAKTLPKETDETIHPDQSAAQALAFALRRGALTYETRRAAILGEDGTPEDVHGARVALRRTRSVLRGFSDMLAPKLAARLQQDLAQRFRALGPLRDADVQAEALSGSGDAGTQAADRARELRASVRAELAGSDTPPLTEVIESVLEKDDKLISGDRRRRLAEAPVGVIASRALQVAWTELLCFGAEPDQLPPESLHEFRKRAKDLRYLTELFGPLFPGKAPRASLKHLKSMQDSLGLLNDLHVMAGPGAKDAALPHDAEAREKDARKAARAAWQDLRRAPLWWAVQAE